MQGKRKGKGKRYRDRERESGLTAVESQQEGIIYSVFCLKFILTKLGLFFTSGF